MTTTVNGTAVPGLLGSIVGTQLVGQQATSPAPKPPTNTLPAQYTSPTAPKTDLSSLYANVGGTIYSKANNTAYTNSADFAKSAGLDPNNINWNSLNFDTTWKPTQQAQPAPQSQPVPQPLPQTNNGILPTLAQSTGQNANSFGLLNAPNNGATGVSQGNLINTQAQQINNPDWDKANAQMAKDRADYAQASQDIGNRAFGASEGLGRGGALDTLYNAKLATDAALLSAALGKQNANTSSLSAATSANAPIQAGAYTSPSASSTTGQTTSGAQSLNSIIGQRMSADGKTTEFFDKSTGKGFATPQALADYVNQQNPGVNVNASNVFQYLQQHGNDTGNNSGLNPIANVNQTAQDVISGRTPYGTAIQQGNNVPGYQNLLNQAITQAGGNITALQAQAAATQANIQTQNTAGTTAASQLYLQKYPEAANLRQAIDNVDDAGKLTVQNTAGQNINPFSFVPLNKTIAEARQLFSSTGQAAFNSNLINLRNLVQNLNATTGGSTPTGTQLNAQGLIDGSMSMAALQTLISQAKQEGELKFQNSLGAGLKGWNDLQSGSSNSNGSTLKGLF